MHLYLEDLGIQAVAMGFFIGVSLGILAAFNRGRWPDYLVMFIAILGVSVPSFVMASLLQYFFTVKICGFRLQDGEHFNILYYQV